jgi:hypothetical protein
MEFFIPGILLFLVSILVTFILAPKATPMVAAVLSIVFLTYGVYDHYRLFASEYNLSTWQDNLKIYSPALMIIAIIIFIIYTIIAVFTKGAVPVPEMPTITMPNVNSITDTVTNTFNNAKSAIVNSIPPSIMPSVGNAKPNANAKSNANAKPNANANANANKNKRVPSVIEAL